MIQSPSRASTEKQSLLSRSLLGGSSLLLWNYIRIAHWPRMSWCTWRFSRMRTPAALPSTVTSGGGGGGGRSALRWCAGLPSALACNGCKHVFYLGFAFAWRPGRGTRKCIPPQPSMSRWYGARCQGTERGSSCPDSLGPSPTGQPFAALGLQRMSPATVEITWLSRLSS